MKQDNWTFRIKGIPPDVKLWSLKDYLFTHVPGLTSSNDIVIGSFAPSVNDFAPEPSGTATVRFKNVPSQFKNGLDEWSIPLDGHKPLVLDTHFKDFTPMNSVDRSLHKFDCVAISGLASHPYGSWKKRSQDEDNDFMWLRDQLPKDQPSFRIMTYGYDTKLAGSESIQTIDHLAIKFTVRLVNLKSKGSLEKPIIFLAHSLGGVILKRALLLLADGSDIHEFILKKVRVAVLFGVPNGGMRTEHLLAMVKSQPNAQLVQNLALESSYLKKLATSFKNVSELRNIKLVVAFETLRSPTVIKNAQGRWERSGPPEVLVTEESATVEGATQFKFPINQDHSNIVKFSENDSDYSTVVSAIEQAINAEPGDHFGFQRAQSYTSTARTSAAAQALLASLERQRPSKSNSIIQTDELEDLRNSLTFEEMHFRQDDIASPQSDTFEWILQKESLGFIAWLQSDRGLYWIRGKAGSGKSTLMKFLSTNERVSEILHYGTLQEYKVVPVWHFFHERGSVLQKSYEGLLRSILLSLVDADKKLANEVFVAFLQPEAKVWNTDKLMMGLENVLKQKKVKITVNMFLDALDEYHGAPETIASLLKTLNEQPEDTWTRIKICFSSRPWDAFRKNFNESAGFRIQEQTQQDVRKYVLTRISRIPELSAKLGNLPVGESVEFIDAIVKRAEGVFLWVRLVLDRMENMIHTTSNFTISNLRQLLLDLPMELHDHYRRTIQRIPSGSRYQAFILLEILHRSVNVTWLDELFYASACAQGTSFQDSLERLQETIKLNVSDTEMSRQLINLCGGLIEVLHGGRPRVQFIHRTVKDFLAKPEVKEAIVGQAYALSLRSENGTTYLAKYWLARDALVMEEARPQDLRNALVYANLSESSTGVHLGDFLDSIDQSAFTSWNWSGFERRCASFGNRVVAKQPVLSVCDSPVTFAICAGLSLYLKDRLSRAPTLDTLAPGRIPLLHCAVLCAVAASRGDRDDLYTLPIVQENQHMDLIQQIMRKNPDLNAKYKGSTAFDLLFEGAELGGFNEAFLELEPPLISIALLFLSKGQNASTTFACETKSGRITTTPLHITLSLAPELITAGADVNALDSQDRTPLDYWIINLATEKSIRSVELVKVLETMTFLVKHGGCMTRQANSYHRRFMEKASGSLRGKGLPSELKSPPTLKGHGFISFIFSRGQKRVL